MCANFQVEVKEGRIIRARKLFLSSFIFQTFCLPESFGDDEFQLSIYTSKFVGGPFFNGIHGVFIDAQYEFFFRLLFFQNDLVY